MGPIARKFPRLSLSDANKEQECSRSSNRGEAALLTPDAYELTDLCDNNKYFHVQMSYIQILLRCFDLQVSNVLQGAFTGKRAKAAAFPPLLILHKCRNSGWWLVVCLYRATGGEVQTLLDVEQYIREQDVIRLMRQILEGLHQLHDNNIAHLDIKVKTEKWLHVAFFFVLETFIVRVRSCVWNVSLFDLHVQVFSLLHKETTEGIHNSAVLSYAPLSCLEWGVSHLEAALALLC